MYQNILADSNNTSIANLAAGAIFVGSKTPTQGQGVVSIQWSLKTDQNCTVYIEESPDGNNWDISYAFDYVASKGGRGETVQSSMSFWRARVENVGLSTTTYFRLSGILCPMAAPLPSGLTTDGRAKTETHITDNVDRHATISHEGELSAVKHVRLIGEAFDGADKDTNIWEETVANGGSISQGSCVVLKTNTTANGSATYNTIRRGRFVPGTSSLYVSRSKVSAFVADNLVRIGAYDDDNGYFMQSQDTVLALGTRKGGVDTLIEDGSFNGDWGNFFPRFTPGLFVTLKIEWTTTSVFFTINETLLHSVRSDLFSNTQTLPVKFENVNTNGSVSEVDLTITEACIMRVGELITSPLSKNQIGQIAENICKYSAGVLRGLVISGVAQNSVITIYDGDVATGTIIWASGAMGAQTQPLAINLHSLPFSIGLSFAITGAASNLLVIYE